MACAWVNIHCISRLEEVRLASKIWAENAANSANLSGVNLCTGIKANDRFDGAKLG